MYVFKKKKKYWEHSTENGVHIFAFTWNNYINIFFFKPFNCFILTKVTTKITLHKNQRFFLYCIFSYFIVSFLIYIILHIRYMKSAILCQSLLEKVIV